MQEILTVSGAVIHIDNSNPQQTNLLPVVLAAFLGEVVTTELTQ